MKEYKLENKIELNNRKKKKKKLQWNLYTDDTKME